MCNGYNVEFIDAHLVTISIFFTIYSNGSGAPSFDGWFMSYLLNVRGATSIGDAPSGLVSIPMTFSDYDGSSGREEQGAIIAGMLGYKYNHPSLNTDRRPSVEPVHGWTLLLEPNSFFRNDLTDWEQKINGVSK